MKKYIYSYLPSLLNKNFVIREFFLLSISFLFYLSVSAQPVWHLTDGITSCLVENSNCSPLTVDSIGDPYLYEGECSIAINRYLARATDVGGLNNLYNPDYNLNETEYCNLVRSFADLDIQMIQRAYFGGANSEHRFYPQEVYYKLGRQIVKDINFIYDCKGKRRPIIQGMAFEWINPTNFGLTTYPIPESFLNEYFKYYPEDLNDPLIRSYYCSNPSGDCISLNKKFDGQRILGDLGAPASINNVEWRMWYLYQAFEQIKMGYTSLHLGIYWSNEMAGNEMGQLGRLADVIRAYAKEKDSFVLLSGETPMQDVNGGLSAKFPGTDRFIFDFDSRAMRPRELTSPSTTGDGNDCSTPIDSIVLDTFNNSPCSGYSLNAVVDPCTINSFGGSTGGFSAHDPDCYLQQNPYTVHFDGFSPPINAPLPSSGSSTLTYGFNDHNWFAMLPAACQSWWYNYFYCERRNYHNGNGFIVIPGVINSQYNTTNYTQTFPPPTYILLHNNTSLYNTIKDNTLNIKKPEIIVNQYLQGGPMSCECNGLIADPLKKYKKRRKCYEVNIKSGTEDCSSVYSVHIKKPDGSWLPQKLNTTNYKFCPDMTGTYEVAIRQDYHGDSVQYADTVINVTELFSCLLVSGKCSDKNPFDESCNGRLINIYFNKALNKFQLNYKSNDSILKTASISESLEFASSLKELIYFQNPVVDLRQDSDNNFYIFFADGLQNKVVKMNRYGFVHWTKEVGSKISNVKDIQDGFQFLTSEANNSFKVNKLDYSGTLSQQSQIIIGRTQAAKFLSITDKIKAWVETNVGFNSLIINYINTNEVIRQLPLGLTVKSIETDINDNVLVSGEFNGEILVNGNTYSSNNFTSLIFIKFNAQGNITNVSLDNSRQNLYLDGTSLQANGDIIYWGKYSYTYDGIMDSCMFFDKITMANSTVGNSATGNSVIRSKTMIENSRIEIDASPNPFNNEIEIKIKSEVNDVGKIILFNNLGQILSSKNLILDQGYNIISLREVKDFPNGIYYLEYLSKTNGKSKMIKIVKVE